ncbi:hypothetical protein GCM10010466_32110 [Planomonospora alba]|uniref:Uncharacterized protein n=1 Tax=Planomonospora alba TaxID=161354 RepID=A0ABP6N9K4_9ACTN
MARPRSALGRRGPAWAVALGAVLLATGCHERGHRAEAGRYLARDFPAVAPERGPQGGGPGARPAGRRGNGWPEPLRGRPRRAEPVAVVVPRAGVDVPVIRGDLLPPGPAGAPVPAGAAGPVGWDPRSPAPGEPGQAVISGSLGPGPRGPGVFARLPALRRNDTVAVARQDGTVVVFGVTSVRWTGGRALPAPGSAAGPAAELTAGPAGGFPAGPGGAGRLAGRGSGLHRGGAYGDPGDPGDPGGSGGSGGDARRRGARGGRPYPAIKLVGREEPAVPGSPAGARSLTVRARFAGWYRLPDFSRR